MIYRLTIQVDYSKDDQWNMWVKVGVRTLVSVDDGVEVLADPFASIHHDGNFDTSLWGTMEQDMTLMNRSGQYLLSAIDWAGSDPETQAANEDQVSRLKIKPHASLVSTDTIGGRTMSNYRPTCMSPQPRLVECVRS